MRRGFRPATILAVLGSIAIVPIAFIEDAHVQHRVHEAESVNRFNSARLHLGTFPRRLDLTGHRQL